jgi:hypothetical protein
MLGELVPMPLFQMWQVDFQTASAMRYFSA